jgi:hypothetical protein
MTTGRINQVAFLTDIGPHGSWPERNRSRSKQAFKPSLGQIRADDSVPSSFSASQRPSEKSWTTKPTRNVWNGGHESRFEFHPQLHRNNGQP